MGEMGKMEKSGGKWGDIGNHERIKMEHVGTSSRVGDKWGKLGEKREKMGGNGEENGA